jgi:hypothetical protein
MTLGVGTPAAAQTQAVERRFSQSKAGIERALVEIRSSEKGRLPILDGFVGPTDQPLERYMNGYYQCSVQIIPAASGGTVVRVVAKITAWYSDPIPVQSGYRTLPSNGRLEGDVLDRLADVLALGPGEAPRAAPSTPAPSSRVPQTPGIRPSVPQALPPIHPGPQGLGAPAAPTPAELARPEEGGGPAAKSDGAAPLTLEREQVEKRLKDLSALAHNLEEILHNQAQPANLAVVRKSGTPVYAKPLTTATALFAAEGQDEFQILDAQSAWVLVQISGASRGWIRRSQLDLPAGFADAPSNAGEPAALAAVSFRLTREDTGAFRGDWQPLRGKTVKIIWVAPTAGQASSPHQKRSFAKSLFLKAYQKLAPEEVAVAGIVVVFDSVDGGQIAVTLADLKRLQDGHLSDAAFWQQCSLDPPESFRDRDKP